LKRSIALWLLAACTLGASAQCMKDTDCKGDRICEKGACTAPVPPSALSRSLTPPVPAPQPNDLLAGGSDPVSLALMDQLKCASNPEPGKAFRALRTRGYIGPKPKLGVDGMSIFDVVRPVTVFGYKVLEITGWEENGDKAFFWRGPGTPPPLNIQVVVEGDPKVVRSELARRVGKGPSVVAASYSQYLHPASEIACYGH
jgi:hypothetical protein